MKFYPAFLIDEEELTQANIEKPDWKDGRLANPDDLFTLEDFCGTPIVKVYCSPRDDGTIIALIADGYVQYNRIDHKRTAVLTGDFDTLQVILGDMIEEHPNMSPIDVFDSYAYQTDATIRYRLKEWVKDTFMKDEEK